MKFSYRHINNKQHLNLNHMSRCLSKAYPARLETFFSLHFDNVLRLLLLTA